MSADQVETLMNDGWRWRNWYVRRYGRRLFVTAPPCRGVRPLMSFTLRPPIRLVGMWWGRDDDDEWEATIGVGVADFHVVLATWRVPTDDGSAR